jgi:hypothetical protein
LKLKAVALSLLVFLLSVPAFAQYFPAQAYVTVLPGRVTAQVYNPYYEPIICNGEVLGQTFFGPVYNAYFNEQFLPAGGYRYAFVQTLPTNHFVNGWARVFCRFARFY